MKRRWFSFRLLTLFGIAATIAIVAFIWTTRNDAARLTALRWAIREWPDTLRRHQRVEYVEGALPDLFIRSSLATDPFQWSTISGRWDIPKKEQDELMPCHVSAYASCVVDWGPLSSAATYTNKIEDGRNNLLEWNWVDLSTEATQHVELRFRLRPSAKGHDEWTKIASNLGPPPQGHWYWYGEKIAEDDFKRRLKQ